MPVVEARSTAAMTPAPSSSDSGSSLRRSRYNTPPQHVSELGVISYPYERTEHQDNLSVNAAPDVREEGFAFSPVQIGELPKARVLAFRNPYITRADEIGLYHGIPGLGHLGLDLVPPEPWKAGDEPVNPEEASYLFEQSRQMARAKHERLNIDGMSGEENAKSYGLWLRDLWKHELIRDHRIDIWNRFVEDKEEPSQNQHHQYQSTFDLTTQPGYNRKPHQYPQPQNDPSVGTLHGQTANPNRQQITGSSGDLPSPSGLDPYLIRQSVKSAVDRFQYQQTQVELTRLQSEMQLGNVLNHFKDHIEKTPLVSQQGGNEALIQGDPASKGMDLAPITISTPAVSTQSSVPPTGSPVPRNLEMIPSVGSCTLPPPRIALDHSSSPTESRGISDRPPIHSMFNDKGLPRDPLFGVTAYPQPTGQRDPPPPIRGALRSNFVSTGYQAASHWAKRLGNAVGTMGTSGTDRPNAGSYRGESPHGGEEGGMSKPEKTTSRVPWKRKEKNEIWHNQFIQNIEHPTHIPAGENTETALADLQAVRGAKPRARRRKVPMAFDEEKGFPITQSMASDPLENRLIRERYGNAKPNEARGSLPGGLGLANGPLTAAEGSLRSLPRDSGSAFYDLVATRRRVREMRVGSGSIAYPQRSNQLPKKALFSTALSQPMSSVRLVSVLAVCP
ncbi:MAG: hypothetical protein M1840_005756 [Geoglossum simile]|nr:MAG: hypothetical protein M1840_005756 [Geoglossum simile]